MLKKKMIMLVAAAMMTLSASSAFAALADFELIRVVYERGSGSTETVTDLGNVNTIIANGGGTFAGTGAFTATTPANLAVAYFAFDGTNGALWASSNTGLTAGDTTTATSGFTGVASYYNSNTVTKGTTTTGQAYGIGLQSAIMSYKNKLSATAGTLSNAFLPVDGIEKSLSSLVGANSGSVSQTLYYWANAYGSYELTPALQLAANTGAVAATITTNFDGSTNVTVTPIPPAFFLMGSGLLGMFGLRRKNKVA